MATLGSLPDNILLKIFSDLNYRDIRTRIRPVNKRFEEICEVFMVWSGPINTNGTFRADADTEYSLHPLFPHTIRKNSLGHIIIYDDPRVGPNLRAYLSQTWLADENIFSPPLNEVIVKLPFFEQIHMRTRGEPITMRIFFSTIAIRMALLRMSHDPYDPELPDPQACNDVELRVDSLENRNGIAHIIIRQATMLETIGIALG